MIFSEYLGGVISTICAATLIDVLIAEGETKKFVKSVVSLFVLASVIIPIPMLLAGQSSCLVAEQTEDASVDTVDAYLGRVYSSDVARREEALENQLDLLGINGVDVHIDIIGEDSGEIALVTVDISSATYSDSEEIKSKIKVTVADSLNISEDMIVIVE